MKHLNKVKGRLLAESATVLVFKWSRLYSDLGSIYLSVISQILREITLRQRREVGSLAMREDSMEVLIIRYLDLENIILRFSSH